MDERLAPDGASCPSALDSQTPVDYPRTTGSDQLQGLRIGPVLDLQHSCSKTLLSVPFNHGNDTLNDNRAVIELWTDQMDCASMDTNAGIERSGMRIEPFESG